MELPIVHIDQQVARALTWRYLIALILVALLATSAWLSLHLVISEQESTAAVVNISGRQRMLSQRAALFSVSLANSSAGQRPVLRGRLQEALDLMRKSHLGLTRGSTELGLPGTMSERVRAMYFEAPVELDRQVSSYLGNLEKLLELPDRELHAGHALVGSIVRAAEADLLAALDAMVSQYQREGEAAVTRLEKTETIVWLLTLLLLAIEAAFIFRPIARHIHAVIAKLQGVTESLRQSQDELEQRVAQRTLDLERKTRELAESADKLRLAASVFANSHDGVIIADRNSLIVDVNPAFSRITGFGREEAVGRSPRLLSSERQTAHFYAEMWRSLRERDFWSGEIWNRRKSGEVYAERLAISVVRDENGELQHYIGIFTDISQVKAHEAELNRIAHYDILTGVPNRRLLADRLGQAIAHARRSQRSLAVCYLDLDGFKRINDQHGHAVGDAMLVEVCGRLKAMLREEDTLARLGGDEFVMILTDLDEPAEVHFVLDRILAAVGSAMSLQGQTVHTSASVGVTLYPADDADPDTLLRHADQAMFMAKEAGKNRYQLFDSEHDRQVRSHRTNLERLREALEGEEFVLHYQPKVDLLTGAVIGAEALIRWQHPERGLLPPGQFLHFVDGSDLEVRLGEWVVASALTQISRWTASGLRLVVSVNISADHLLHPQFADRLGAALERHPDVRPEYLELEILETVALADVKQAVDTLTVCRRLGVRFALDDFGTGYSSLAYFRSLPVDILKIDQSFVRDMLADPGDLSLVESVAHLAKAFNREVIAEGVETLDHGALLLQFGCHLAQGYGIARPMPPDELPAWIDTWLARGQWKTIDSRVASSENAVLLVAAQSHRNWTEQIVGYIQHPEPQLAVALDSAHCRFGRWYRGSGIARYRDYPEFMDIGPLHETVHVIATGLVALMQNGQEEAAREGLPELCAARDRLIGKIMELVART